MRTATLCGIILLSSLCLGPISEAARARSAHRSGRSPARSGDPGEAAERTAPQTAWTLILQLPAARTLRLEDGGATLQGAAAPLLLRLRRGRRGVRAVRRLVAGTVSIQSRRVEELRLAGQMLIVTVALSPTTRVHVVATNRMPMSEDPSHRALIDPQILAGHDLHARAPFGVVDERGRTAVLFQ